MSDIECPYCEAELEVCHDDGQGYAEDVRHEMECCECGKTFVFNTYISFTYHPERADCLNGSPHQLGEWVRLFDHDGVTVERRCCADCDYTQRRTQPTQSHE